ncbi:MAG: gliding motility-associated C-terminal domain-containing protein [Bacteroidota bacterium]
MAPHKLLLTKILFLTNIKSLENIWVKLKAFDRSTCAAVDSTQTIINVFVPDMHAGPDQNICFGSSTNLDATGAASYSWTSTDKRFSSDIKQPPVSPEDTTLYILNMIDADGCTRTDSLQVNVIPSIDLSFDFEKVYDCQNRPYLKVKSTSKLKPDEDVAFFFGDGQSSNEMETTHSYELDGVYSVTLRGTKDVCAYQVSREIPIITLQIPNVITPGEEDGLNDTFRIRYGDPAVLTSDAKIGLKIMDRWGVNVYESKDYRNDWKGADLDEGVYYFEANVLGEVQCKGWVHLIK